MRPKAAENRIPGIWYLRHAYREMLEWRLIRVSLSVLGAGVLTLTVVSPMGIEESLGPLQRLAFVALCGVCCWPLCHALSAAILYVARSRPPLQILLACLSGALFMAVPLSAVVFTAYGLFQPRLAANLRLPEVYLNTGRIGVGVWKYRPLRGLSACQARTGRESRGKTGFLHRQRWRNCAGRRVGTLV